MVHNQQITNTDDFSKYLLIRICAHAIHIKSIVAILDRKELMQ
jgi:hypothetical protein